MDEIKEILPFSTDDIIFKDEDDIEYVYIWSYKGVGWGRVAMIYGECGIDKIKLAHFIVRACNIYFKFSSFADNTQEWFRGQTIEIEYSLEKVYHRIDDFIRKELS